MRHPQKREFDLCETTTDRGSPSCDCWIVGVDFTHGAFVTCLGATRVGWKVMSASQVKLARANPSVRSSCNSESSRCVSWGYQAALLSSGRKMCTESWKCIALCMKVGKFQEFYTGAKDDAHVSNHHHPDAWKTGVAWRSGYVIRNTSNAWPIAAAG